ncbi:MAG TPA: cell division protein FtsB [Burkholderiaceae bacterium]|jgi:cell division protein FtsB|nr:cell division protein FtsB [Burkholderiaceae bacterium]
MRLLLIVLVLLTAITQYPLWWGKGGWQRVRELETKLQAQEEINEALTARNNALAAEVQDLTAGTDAIEERARTEMGLVQKDEIFVHLLPGAQSQQPGQSSGSKGKGSAAGGSGTSGSASR